MQQDKTSNINEKKITLCSLIPGMGQFVNGQAFKGIVFFAIFVLFIGQMLLGGFHALVGLVTLGSIPMEDHSLFILIEGTLQFHHYNHFLDFLRFESFRRLSSSEDASRGQKNQSDDEGSHT